MESHAVIEVLPVTGDQRAVLIETANFAFDKALERLGPENESLTRKLWDPGEYIDGYFRDKELPINLDYAGYLIEAFLVHHVIHLAEQADEQAARPST